MSLKFLTGEPALLTDRTLVIADLHIGIEHELRQAGIRIPSQTTKMKARIDRLLKNTRASKLLILGDVKHKVPGVSWQEMREIPELLEHFAKKVKIEVVPGNHDAELKNLVPGLKIWPSKGFLFDNIYFNHGHAWPGHEFLKANWLVIAHSHPQLEFRNRFGYRWSEQIWVQAELIKSRIKKKYGNVKTLPKLVIMPSFNSFAGGVSINSGKKALGPVMRSANLKQADIYLLDGTALGKLKKLPA